jgi:hypothetical protein
MFCVPGVLWLLIQSRWHESEVSGKPLGMPDPAASVEEDVLEGRIG